jgi:hypothetical protein
VLWYDFELTMVQSTRAMDGCMRFLCRHLGTNWCLTLGCEGRLVTFGI